MHVKKHTLVIVLFLYAWASASAFAQNDPIDDVEPFLHQLFAARTRFLVDKHLASVQPFYLPEEKRSRLALAHERKRADYIAKWAEIRGVTFTNASGAIRVIRINRNGDIARVSLVQSQQLTYQYREHETQTMGIGTRHVLTLKKQNGNWHVLKEWYLDPLDENPNLIPSYKNVETEMVTVEPLAKKRWRQPYDREKAVEYANKYAGLANKPGTNQRYNQKYRDYTYSGGDCTNFTSQVLGDPEEGGGLPMRPDWNYRSYRGGNVAWVRTDSFRDFLIRSGYGRLVAYGTYDQVAKPTKKFPKTALAELKPGDIIGYELHGDIDHFSIVTARDVRGYVLVNSHTADRHHVPWDLGWDKYTKFHLIQVRD